MKNRVKQLAEMMMGAALSSIETQSASYAMACHAVDDGIPGTFVECGVYAGVQAALMAHGAIDKGDPRHVHLFDTFTGIPAGGPEDTNWTHPAGTSACSLQRVLFNMKKWGVPESLLFIHEGLVENTVPSFAELCGPIAILRIDVDLFEPTQVILQHLMPKVSRGGWIIADDFGLPGARKAVLEHLPDVPIYWRKPI